MEELKSVLKVKNGQSGPDGNRYVRNKRIELRVCEQEYLQIEGRAKTAGYANMAQYLRESGLSQKQITSPTLTKKEIDRWLYAVNRIGNNLNQIARIANQQQHLDDEVLSVLTQIMDMANETMVIAQKAIKLGAIT